MNSRIPRLYAAASLKRYAFRVSFVSLHCSIPRLYAAASLKRTFPWVVNTWQRSIPRLYAAASLKRLGKKQYDTNQLCIPRLYAAASLKHSNVMDLSSTSSKYSAALCRGLIEAIGGLP